MPAIYLDNNTTAKPSEKAISKMMPFYTTMWGVPSQPHQKGQELFPALRESFKQIYDFIGAKETDQVIFTSSGTEAVNHVISSVYRDVTLPTGKNQFITSQLSEAAALMAIEKLEPLGCIGKLVEVNEIGIVTSEALANTISPRTALISLSWANGLTGVIQPFKEIASLCRQRGILLHIDATHILGKIVYELEDVGADFITFNGDQLHAPKGTGALYIRHGVKCSPFIVGGSDQGGQRAGAYSIAHLVALSEAAKEALDSRDYMCTEIARLRDKLEKGIKDKYPMAEALYIDQERLPNCTTIIFPNISNEALLFYLNRKAIYASIGGGNFQQLALTLLSCKMKEDMAYGAISFCLSRYTKEEEIDSTINAVAEAVTALAKMSSQITLGNVL